MFFIWWVQKICYIKIQYENTRLQEDDGYCSRLYKKIGAIPNKVRIAR